MNKIICLVLISFGLFANQDDSFNFNDIKLGSYIDKSLKSKTCDISPKAIILPKALMSYYKINSNITENKKHEIYICSKENTPFKEIILNTTPNDQIYKITPIFKDKFFETHIECKSFMLKIIKTIKNNKNITIDEYDTKNSSDILFQFYTLKNSLRQEIVFKCSSWEKSNGFLSIFKNETKRKPFVNASIVFYDKKPSFQEKEATQNNKTKEKEKIDKDIVEQNAINMFK